MSKCCSVESETVSIGKSLTYNHLNKLMYFGAYDSATFPIILFYYIASNPFIQLIINQLFLKTKLRLVFEIGNDFFNQIVAYIHIIFSVLCKFFFDFVG